MTTLSLESHDALCYEYQAPEASTGCAAVIGAYAVMVRPMIVRYGALPKPKLVQTQLFHLTI